MSTHKTLAAFTQTAVLLSGKSCPFSRNEIVEALSLFQSTSPSYPMMLSIESSVLEPADWDAHTERVKSLRSRLESIEGICLVPEDLGVISDPTRLNVICRGLSGYELQKALEVESIVPEMSDRECVTLITSPADPDEWYERLYSALSVISGKSGDNGKASEYSPVIIRPGETLLSVRDALFAPFEYIPLKDAVGRISARPAGCYPPGVAVLFPGERITAENAEFLIRERSSGAELFGINNGCAAVLK